MREFLLGPEPPRFSEFVAHRAIFPTEALRGIKIPDCTKWWGPDRHILVYFMTSKRDEVYVIGVVPRRELGQRCRLAAELARGADQGSSPTSTLICCACSR